MKKINSSLEKHWLHNTVDDPVDDRSCWFAKRDWDKNKSILEQIADQHKEALTRLAKR